ncbi:hypothetical protein [Helicobacter salomonis]|uniref:hypothetical protein n=1 Tax=Helicobacter salomonis TaxID=56878 RepID=UPI000CF14C43|nr:hypothetical protein [Helicobacter salomonis]
MYKVGAWGVLGALLWGCGGAPGWVNQCAKPANIQQDKVVACGVADILDDDIESATSLAGTKARDKLADFVLQTHKQESGAKRVHVELQGTELRTKWVAPDKVFVLVDMDVQMSKQAQITEEKPAPQTSLQDKAVPENKKPTQATQKNIKKD